MRKMSRFIQFCNYIAKPHYHLCHYNLLKVRPYLISKCYNRTYSSDQIPEYKNDECSTVQTTTEQKCSKNVSLIKKVYKNSLPYAQLMRLDRPIGSWLLFWPCGWGIGLSALPGTLPDMSMLALFGAGAFIMRGAGCTINDLWDRNLDGKVERTRNRPLVTGQVTPFDAVVFLSAQLGIGCFILLQLNWYSIVLGASSLALVVAYPLMKRITDWPQLVLGMTFNWGVLLGWSATQGTIDLAACLPLYVAGVCWTIVYDTIYAHQDKKDDIAVGIKSTAIKFGEDTKPWLTGFTLAMTAGLLSSGIICDQTWPYFTSVGIVATHLAHQIYTLNIDNQSDCAKKFFSNHQIGLILFIGIVLGTYLKDGKPKKNIVDVDIKASEMIAKL